MTWEIQEGDCVDVLRELDAGSVQTCVTSPPYWGLRDYGTATWEGGDSECDHLRSNRYSESTTLNAKVTDGASENKRTPYLSECGKCGAKRIDSQLGLEPTPEEYVANLVSVFREVRRVLRDDGTVWLNLGDSYAGSWGAQSRGLSEGGKSPKGAPVAPEVSTAPLAEFGLSANQIEAHPKGTHTGSWVKDHATLKPKDLVGIPWRVAFALQADGWWLRSDIIWAKPNPMPESVTDRPTRAHEYVFLLSKSARYFYDADAIREPASEVGIAREGRARITPAHSPPGTQPNRRETSNGDADWLTGGRNRRSVWEIATQPYSEAHFATFPPKLVEPCILAGSPPKCCGECGVPWERVVEVVAGDRTTDTVPSRLAIGHQAVPRPRSSHPPGWRKMEADERRMDWCQTCEHNDDSGGSIVLDPFAGAGTTGLVAALHGRDFIGIELNPEYAEMARERIRRWEANPAGALEGDPEPIDGQEQLRI